MLADSESPANFDKMEEDAGLLDGGASGRKSEVAELPEIPFCGCLSVTYYKPFFDIDTSEVSARLSSALIYLKKDDSFMSMVSEKPDAYGPFWISTTLIFVVAVTSHLSSWIQSWMKGVSWFYDFQSVLTVASIIYSFAGGAPFGIWVVLRQFDAKLKLVTAVCLYGYSLILFIPAALLCAFPYEFVSWLTLLGAASLSSLFLLRNLAPVVVAHTNQNAALVLGGIGSIQIIFMLFVKLCFF